MNQPNRGKDFEKEIFNCINAISTASIDRLPDSMSGYAGVRNVCDYQAFQAPDEFYIECKCLYGNTLNYKGAIRPNQWEGMEAKSKIRRCVAGVVVWFIDYDITVFIAIQDLIEHRNKGNKSLNIKDITREDSIRHFIVDGVRKRVMFKYLGDGFLYQLHKLSNEIWGEYKV